MTEKHVFLPLSYPNPFPRTWSFNVVTIGIWSQVMLCCQGCCVHSGMFSSILDHHPLDVSAKCTLEDQITPAQENHCPGWQPELCVLQVWASLAPGDMCFTIQSLGQKSQIQMLPGIGRSFVSVRWTRCKKKKIQYRYKYKKYFTLLFTIR